MTLPLKAFVAATAIAVMPAIASAANVVFDTTLLQTSTTVSNDGVTMTASASNGGTVETYSGGAPNGLYIGGGGSAFSIFPGPENTGGSYNLNFDQAIHSIEIRFGWLTNRGDGEKIFDFEADGGSVFAALSAAISTSQDLAGVVTSSTPTGQGTLTYDAGGATFNDFSFKHTQSASNNIGFVISNIVVNVSAVPLPAGLPLLLGSVAALGLVRRLKR